MQIPFIRLAAQGDLPEIVAIYNSTIASRMVTADTEPVTVESRWAWLQQHDNPTRPLWVMQDDQGVLGWLSYSNFYGRPAYAGTAELSVYLHERARGQGLGKRFLAFALQQAPFLGIHVVLGFVFDSNLASCKLFEGAHFKPWGKLPGVAVLDGEKRDLLIYGIPITKDPE